MPSSKSFINKSNYQLQFEPIVEINEEKKLADSDIDLDDSLGDISQMKSFSCKCGKKFRKFVCFMSHKKYECGGKIMKCTRCQRVFGKLDWLLTHMKTVKCVPVQTSQRNEFVKSIQNPNLNQNQMQRPIKTDELNNILGKKVNVVNICTCACGKSFDNQETLATHQKVECGRNFECKICKRKFTNDASLQGHSKKSLCRKVWRAFTCTCGKTFNESKEYVSHLDEDCGWDFACTRCHLRFMTISSVQKHMKKASCTFKKGKLPHVPKKFASYTCKCSKKFTKAEFIKDHITKCQLHIRYLSITGKKEHEDEDDVDETGADYSDDEEEEEVKTPIKSQVERINPPNISVASDSFLLNRPIKMEPAEDINEDFTPNYIFNEEFQGCGATIKIEFEHDPMDTVEKISQDWVPTSSIPKKVKKIKKTKRTRCPKCAKSVETRKLNYHITRECGRIRTCPRCDKKFHSIGGYTYHMNYSRCSTLAEKEDNKEDETPNSSVVSLGLLEQDVEIENEPVEMEEESDSEHETIEIPLLEPEQELLNEITDTIPSSDVYASIDNHLTIEVVENSQNGIDESQELEISQEKIQEDIGDGHEVLVVDDSITTITTEIQEVIDDTRGHDLLTVDDSITEIPAKKPIIIQETMKDEQEIVTVEDNLTKTITTMTSATTTSPARPVIECNTSNDVSIEIKVPQLDVTENNENNNSCEIPTKEGNENNLDEKIDEVMIPISYNNPSEHNAHRCGDFDKGTDDTSVEDVEQLAPTSDDFLE